MTGSSPLKVGVPEILGTRARDYMPATAQVIVLADDGPLPANVDGIEFFVPMFNRPRVRDILPRLRSLKVIQTMSAGVDWVISVVPSGVTICDARGIHDIPVSEWIVTAILSTYKQFPVFEDRQRKGVWERPRMSEPDIADLAGKKILILGYGSIGRAAEDRLTPFGVDIIRVARRPRTGVHGLEEVRDLLPLADVVILLLPLTDATRGIVDEAFLKRMKGGALLVNAARGPLVDTDALLRLLASGRIKAALDVADPEPIPDGHELWKTPNTLITPHIAGNSPEFTNRACRFIGSQVERFSAQEPLKNVVEDGY